MNIKELLRFIAAIEIADSGCWNWTRGLNGNGYPSLYCGAAGGTVGGHRLAYEYWVGLIPAKFVVDHLCRNRRCVNPDHLEAVPHRTNIKRGLGPVAANLNKFRCKYGHWFLGDNTYIEPKTGYRQCRICRSKRNYPRKKPMVSGATVAI